MQNLDDLKNKINEKKVKIGVIGIGYVGSALALSASSAGLSVIGFTRKKYKADRINKKNIKNFSASSDFTKLSKCDIVCICVPTPIYGNKKPDLRPLKSSLSKTAKYIKKGQLIIIESSVAPGTTRSVALPSLEKFGLVAGKDFFLSFSPERVDPGNDKFTLENTPKVVSGVDSDSLKLAVNFYEKFIKKVVPVSSLETAEMTKILENTYRLVNISLINELMEYTNSIGVDIWEVVDAAKTKPFGFMAHYPGPGIGGHCIPVDPYYLIDDANKIGINLSIVEQAGKINDKQPQKVVKKAMSIVKNGSNNGKKHQILLIGIAYKANIDDIRESPALKIWEMFEKEGFSVSYHDPFVPNLNGYSSTMLTNETIQEYDLIVITTNHSSINYDKFIGIDTPILDTRNVYNDDNSYPNIYSL